MEYKYSPDVIDLVLSGEVVQYTELSSGEVLYKENYDDLESLIISGVVKSEKVGVKAFLGDKLYKWVNKDLTSVYSNSFKYVLGEEITPSTAGSYNNKSLYFCTKEDVLGHYYGHHDSRVCIEVDYREEDIQSIRGSEIKVSRVTPRKVLGNKKEVSILFSEKQDKVIDNDMSKI